MARLMSYFVFSIILGIFPLYNAENFEDTKKAQPAYYTPDQTSSRDARDYRTRDGSEENALPDYYRNNFDCSVHRYSYGMYADLDFQCQVYHVCHNGRKESFLCPTGTLFNQQILSCDHWYSVRCQDSPNFYHVNELLGKSSNNTYNGLGWPYSTRRFPARPSYGQQGYGSLHSQNQLTPYSETDQANNTRYGSDQRGISEERDRYGPSTGYNTQSQFGRPGQYGDSQVGSPRPTGSQSSSWDRQQTESPFDRQPIPTGSQSSLFNRRQPQPGFQGSSFDTQKPLAGVKGTLSDRRRIQPGSLRPEYPYGRQFPSTGSQRFPLSQPQPGDRFSSGRQPSVTESRGSPFDKPELRPGSPESSFDTKQPGSGRYPDGRQPTGSGRFPNGRQPFSTGSTRYPDGRQPFSTGSTRYPDGRQPFSTGSTRYPDGRQPFSTGSTRYPDGRQPFPTGSTRSPFGRPESGRFDGTKPETNRYHYGEQPSSHTTLGPSFDRSKIGSERYPSGRHTSQPGSRGSVFGRPDVRPASPDSQPGSGRYPYGRQPFEQPDRTRPGSDQYSFGREPSEIGKPYGRPGSQQPPSDDNRLTGRRYPYTTGSAGYDVQKPVGFGSLSVRTNTSNQFSTYPRGSGLLNYNNKPSDLQNTRFTQPPRGFSGSRYNNLQSPNYGRGSHPLSRPEIRGSASSPSWRYNEFSSQTSSEWATDSPLNVPRDDLQTDYGSPDRLSNRNYTSAFGSHQKSSEVNVKDRSMLGQPSRQGESSVPSSDEKGLKPILVYQNHVPVSITKNSTEDGSSSNEEVPAYKLYYVKEDQIKS